MICGLVIKSSHDSFLDIFIICHNYFSIHQNRTIRFYTSTTEEVCSWCCKTVVVGTCKKETHAWKSVAFTLNVFVLCCVVPSQFLWSCACSALFVVVHVKESHAKKLRVKTALYKVRSAWHFFYLKRAFILRYGVSCLFLTDIPCPV